MKLPPNLLDQWLSAHDFSEPPISFNLASSTGPRWTLDAVAELGGIRLDIGSIVMSYAEPEGTAGLRDAIGAFHEVDPASVLATTGASEAISALFCLMARPGGDIVIPDPGYPAYEAMAAAWNLDVKRYRLDFRDGFSQHPDAPSALVDANTVAVVVNTPHNPTGTVMERDEIATFAERLSEKGVPLIVDEVYHPLYFDCARPSAAGLPNVIVIGDMSKAFSLPGLRTGWIIDSDSARRQGLVEARSYFTISGSPVLEGLAAHALTHRSAVMERLNEVAIDNLQQLDRFMESNKDLLSWVRPLGGTTAFPWFSDGRDSRPACEALAKIGVLVAPGDCFGHPSHMRLGFCQQTVGFDTALERFAEVLRS